MKPIKKIFTRKALQFFFKYPHLKTFYKSGIFSFGDILNIYHNIIEDGNSVPLFGSTFYGLEKVNYYTLDEIFTSKVYDFDSDKKQPIIIDCGANIGLSILYFKQKHPDSIIYAFEPDSINYGYLEKNTISYSWQNTVTLYQQMVSNEKGFEYFEELGNAGSRISLSKEGKEIEKIRLKDFLESIVNEIDFLKIDIEGSEFDVLPDIKTEFPKIKKMYIEFHCHDSDFDAFYHYVFDLLSDHFYFQITTNFLENENIYSSIEKRKVKTYYNCFAVNKN